ncbi:hypothetical protein FPE01S_02_00670 [Flavihumibacter petaseus NBRC 106054]|uniref:Uncharacterized protein n=2 Tax=Flavihumibacter TaxID=1004301 RepID=A0A0E9MZ20_9BACT|nr:hypothetical protein FPE01S_02_00670 [Flavihumibacter petaseus NBRC 106054]
MLMTKAQNLKTPAPSPGSTVKQDFALSSVEVSYSRPAVKGRKIFGDLVPYGKVWRTGANGATVITFGDDVIIDGKPVPAGKYGLLTIPGEKEWTVILSKQLDVTSPAAYKQDQDFLRMKAKPSAMPFKVENFAIVFDEIMPTSMNLEILWDKTSVSIPIKAEIDSKVTKQIDELMKTDNPPYFSAAMYYMESGKDLNQALSWFDKGIEKNPDAFWMYYQKANCLAKLGKKQEAIAASSKSTELAKTAQNDDYVELNRKLMAKLK